MSNTILVTGGTGTLGRPVVEALRSADRLVRVLSRHAGPGEPGIESVAADLTTGTGVEAAVEGAEVIIHLAGTRQGDETKTLHLVQAAVRSGARHLVYISVVGADRVPVRGRMDRAMFGYFDSKLAAERVVENSGLPWTTLRATQFQQTFLSVARGMAKLPIIPVPSGFKFQPVDAREVAARLTELAVGPPAGLVPEMGGPEVLGMDRADQRLPSGDGPASPAALGSGVRRRGARVPRRGESDAAARASAERPGRRSSPRSWPRQRR